MKSSTRGVFRVLTSVRVRALLSLGVVASVGATGTFAYWTDAVSVTGTSFTAGTIILQANGADDTLANGYAALSLATFVPGNSTAGVVTIKNNGTAPLKYSAASSSDASTLSDAMVVKVTNDATTSGSLATAKTCAGTALAGTTTTLNTSLITTKRSLAAGASETICIQVALPTSAHTSLQGASSAVTFTFTATSDLS
jgi:predicted ribosomally synthesized peptide with SipW-like signal peptide